jgi:hypothetical protein
MRVGILYAEDPSFFSPLVREVIRLRPQSVVAVLRAGSRSAGPGPKRWEDRLERIGTLWLIWQTPGFLRELTRRLLAMVTRRLGPRFDTWSVEAAARSAGIPFVACQDPNAPAFIDLLETLELDVLFNQTDRILKTPLLTVPWLGVVNRHGSLLPRFRGRMASFWSHAAEPPEEGVTFHLVDEGLDTGPILLQSRLEVDPRWSYPQVLGTHRDRSPGLFWEAVDRLYTPGFAPAPNPHEGTPIHRFPTWEQALRYRRVLRARRKRDRRRPTD